MRPFIISVGAMLAFATLSVEPARAIPIDLNLFYADPSVVVAADGSSATLHEDDLLASVILSNDPGLGDPTALEPAIDVLLTFDYAFTEEASGIDEFFGQLFDAATREILASWFCEATCAGSAVVDLTPFSPLTLGLEFQLNSIPPDDANRLSTLTVGNLAVAPKPVSVPEPSTLALLSVSGLALFAWRRRRSTIP